MHIDMHTHRHAHLFRSWRSPVILLHRFTLLLVAGVQHHLQRGGKLLQLVTPAGPPIDHWCVKMEQNKRTHHVVKRYTPVGSHTQWADNHERLRCSSLSDVRHQGNGLQRLPQPHAVAKNTANSLGVQTRQPLETDFLVVIQFGLQRLGRRDCFRGCSNAVCGDSQCQRSDTRHAA